MNPVEIHHDDQPYIVRIYHSGGPRFDPKFGTRISEDILLQGYKNGGGRAPNSTGANRDNRDRTFPPPLPLLAPVQSPFGPAARADTPQTPKESEVINASKLANGSALGPGHGAEALPGRRPIKERQKAE